MYTRESKIMRKLLGKTVPDATTGDISITGQAANPTAYRSTQPQNAVYPVGNPVSRLDVAPDRRTVVLGGSHVLKTVILESPESSSFKFSDGVDIRAAITSQKAAGPRANIVTDQLNIADVKFHGNTTIFTACASGKIFAYDLTRVGTGGSEPLEFIQIQEDSRQVRTLDVNPHLKSWLLSGSQDGIVRVFDASNPLQGRGGFLTFRQRFAPLRCNDPVAQVKWSPRVGHEMACCTDTGMVLKWDVRQPSRPLLRINAHDKGCTAIAWHPDGTHLMSAGKDTKLHIWDLSSTADKRQKPKWTISTSAPVAAIAWRPGLWSATAQTRRVAQVAVSYDEGVGNKFGTSKVHIYDLARPTMPYKEIERFDNSPAALLWQDQDMLWTVGVDSAFNQCDVAFAPKTLDRLSSSAMSFSPKGDVVMFLDERQHARPRPITASHHEVIPRSLYGSSPSSRMLSISKSDSEDDVVGTFLGPRRKSQRKRRPSARPGNPPSGSGDEQKQVLGLEQSINMTGNFKSAQTMASGRIPAAKSVHVYHYLSSVYLENLERDLPYMEEGGKSLVERVGGIMEKYATAAENASLFRLSQTWRILAYAIVLLLQSRAQYHLGIRLGRFEKSVAEGSRDGGRLKPTVRYGGIHSNGDDTPRRQSGQNSIDGRFHPVRSLLSEEIESTSNVPTPIARPVDDMAASYDDRSPYQHGRKLTPILEPESFDLGPSAHASYKDAPRQRLDSEPISITSQDSEPSITEGYDFYDTEALTRAIPVPMNRVTSSGGRTVQGRNSKGRQGSNESFSQVFSISNGTKKIGRSSSSSDVFHKPGLNRQDTDYSKASEGSSIEYESRLRGESMDISPKQTAGLHGPAKPRADSPEEVFLISQTTMETDDTDPSQTSGTLQPASSVTRRQKAHPAASIPVIETEATSSPAKSHLPPRYDTSTEIIENDYLPWADDPPYPFPTPDRPGEKHIFTPPSPLDPYTLLTRALEFESRTSALNVAAMILLLRPLVPDSIIDFHRANGTLRQYHSRLMGMSLFVEAALLRKLCLKGWPGGMPEWGDNYTAIFNQAQEGIKIGLFCASCQKPREVDPAEGDLAVWTCERCETMVAPCAVCHHREVERPDSIPEEVKADTEPTDSWLCYWWYCPGCGHGGHASCLHIWHGVLDESMGGSPSAKYSGGACPMDGCAHACLPGKYRGETTTARSDELGRATVDSSRSKDGPSSRAGSRRTSPRGTDRSVKSDGYDIPQSKAVGKAREALNRGSSSGNAGGGGSGGSGGGGGGGILSSSPGRVPGTGDRERRKSVKFAPPGHASAC